MLAAESAADSAVRQAALAGLRAYQEAPRPPAPPAMPTAMQAGRAVVRDHSLPGAAGPAVLVIPSLINPPSILDLSPRRSLMRRLAARGMRAFLLDWGTPDASDRDRDLAAHVEQVLLPLIARMAAPPVLVGYCLGGTLALAAAALARVAGVAVIAAPWHFAGYGEDARADAAALWREAEPACAALGVVPMEVLQTIFWRLDPARTIAKYAAFAAMPPDSEAARGFVTMEDWANGGAPLPYAAGRDLFTTMLVEDRPGRGDWLVGGRKVDPAALPCPGIAFVSTGDRIVPAATAAGLAPRRDVASGHVGMIVGRHADAAVLTPLGDWIAALPKPT